MCGRPGEIPSPPKWAGAAASQEEGGVAQTPRWKVPQTGTAHVPVGKKRAFMKDLEAASGNSLVFVKDLMFIYIKRKMSGKWPSSQKVEVISVVRIIH